jgi:hypothetical protein
MFNFLKVFMPFYFEHTVLPRFLVAFFQNIVFAACAIDSAGAVHEASGDGLLNTFAVAFERLGRGVGYRLNQTGD